MTSAVETFIVELARSTSRRTHRLLRRVPKPDRDDIMSTAILACWENRDSAVTSGQSLEDWFMDALFKARDAYRRRGTRRSHEELGEYPVPDDALIGASGESTAELILRHFDADQRKAIAIIEGGDTTRVAKRLKWKPWQERAFRAKIRALRDQIPELPQLSAPRESAHTARHVDSDNLARDNGRDAVDFTPAEGKDCPPCWKCRWYDGWLPAHYKPTMLAEPEIEAAVRAVELRKIEIANNVTTRGH